MYSGLLKLQAQRVQQKSSAIGLTLLFAAGCIDGKSDTSVDATVGKDAAKSVDEDAASSVETMAATQASHTSASGVTHLDSSGDASDAQSSGRSDGASSITSTEEFCSSSASVDAGASTTGATSTAYSSSITSSTSVSPSTWCSSVELDAGDGGNTADADAGDPDASELDASVDSSTEGGGSTGSSDVAEAGAGYYCSACSVNVPNRGCREHAYELEYEGGVPLGYAARFEAIDAFTCNEPPPSPCQRTGRWRVSFPNWEGCQFPLSYPQENGNHVVFTSFDFSYPTSEPNGDPFELVWDSGSDACTMRGRMSGSWQNESESGGFSFEITLRANGDSACGTLHYIEGGFAARELVTAAVAERIP